MNIKTSTLVAFIGSVVYGVCEVYSLLAHGDNELTSIDGLFGLANLVFPVCLIIFFFTLWLKQK